MANKRGKVLLYSYIYRAYIIIKEIIPSKYKNVYLFICLFVYLFISVVYLLFFLCISKLNRTFDCVLGTPFWMYKKKCEHFFLCISKLNRTFAFFHTLKNKGYDKRTKRKTQ